MFLLLHFKTSSLLLKEHNITEIYDAMKLLHVFQNLDLYDCYELLHELHCI